MDGGAGHFTFVEAAASASRALLAVQPPGAKTASALQVGEAFSCQVLT